MTSALWPALHWLPLQPRQQGQHRLRVLRLLLHALPPLLLLPRLAARLLAAPLAVPWGGDLLM